MGPKRLRTYPLIRMRGTATIKEAAQMISDMSIGALGVDDDEGSLAGLFTERDLAWTIAQGKDPASTCLVDVMNDFPVMVEGPLTVHEAGARMIASHIRHLIIKEGEELRIVSTRDLMRDLFPDVKTHSGAAAELRRAFGDSFKP